jgi:hypothetical protein
MVNVSNKANGTVEIYEGDKLVGSGPITNGTAAIDLNRLSGGVHEVIVKFITSDDYNNNVSTKAKFEVIKANSTIVNIAHNGNDVIVTVGPNGVTGTVMLVVNGHNTTAEIDSHGNATFRGVLGIGDNFVTAIYLGNVNYTSAIGK